jgi:opacity protein-like surface antigen
MVFKSSTMQIIRVRLCFVCKTRRVAIKLKRDLNMTRTLKKAALLATSVAAMMAFSASAYASNHMYAGLGLGANMTPDSEFDFNNAGTTHPAKIDSKTGFNTGLRLGMSDGPVRYEGEFGYMRSKVDAFSINGTNQSNMNGSVKNLTALANVYYDFVTPNSPMSYFAGVGLGWAKVKRDIDTATTDKVKGDDNVLAYQARGGLAYQLDSNLVGTLDYTYYRTADAEFQIKDSADTARTVKEHLARHAFTLGFAYNI